MTCGYGLDLLRSCYTAVMQFGEDGSINVPVRWFFCPPGTPPYPGFHQFGSGIWETRSLMAPGIGEQFDSPFAYSNGATPSSFSSAPGVVGPVQYLTSPAPADAARITLNEQGLPSACDQRGKVQIGGQSVVDVHGFASRGGLKVGGTWIPGCTHFTPQVVPYLKTAAWDYRPPDAASPGVFEWLWPGTFHNISIRSYSGPCNTVDYGSTRMDVDYLTGDGFANAVHPYFNSPDNNYSIWVVPSTARILGGTTVVLKWVQFPHYEGGGGLSLGGEVQYQKLATSGGGLKLGGRSVQALVTKGGVKLGGHGGGVLETAASGGLNLSGANVAQVGPIAGTGGLKLGGSAIESKAVASQGGVKLGGSSTGSQKIASTGGIKLGGSSTHTQGFVEPCCPGQLIPLTITGTKSNGKVVSPVATALNSGWDFSDPDTGALLRLFCQTVGMVSTWTLRFTTNPPGCVQGQSGLSVNCAGHSVTVTLTPSGTCSGGPYTYTFTW